MNKKQPTSKPPRPPAGVKHPYAPREPVEPAPDTENLANRRISTPPRKAGDAGIPVDRNFVNDDWDEEDDHPVKAPSKGDVLKSGKDQKSSVPIGSGVRSDPNWLEEDFDD